MRWFGVLLVLASCGGSAERSFDRTAALAEISGGNASVGYEIVNTAEEWCLTLDDRDYEMTIAVSLDSGESVGIDMAEATRAGCTR